MMNFRKLPSHIIKNFSSVFIFILLGLIINRLGICQVQKLDSAKDQQQKAELTENNSVNVIPYTEGASASLVGSSTTQGSKLEQTVKGLKDAGYSLDEVTVILKNDKNDASTVSIACLKQGFNGQQIYKSLLKSGYSKKSADLAVPLSIRQEIQILGISTNYNEAIDSFAGKNNAEKIEAKTQNNQVSLSVAENLMQVPVSVGVTFNGLSNWNSFQDKRFSDER
ncbi:MAG: hypothetical protein KKD05_03900 [Candidatus Omnitrophica bacterium]|nr:hypothetical protein [Candidatus Omnitrophota bacterium]